MRKIIISKIYDDQAQTKFKFNSNFFIVSGMFKMVLNGLAEADTVVKQEFEEDSSIVIVDELKQDRIQDNCQNHENYVDVLDDAGSTMINIKQECEEEDPLHLSDNLMKGLQSYSCHKCDKSFTQKSHLNIHMKNVHESHQPWAPIQRFLKHPLKSATSITLEKIKH